MKRALTERRSGRRTLAFGLGLLLALATGTAAIAFSSAPNQDTKGNLTPADLEQMAPPGLTPLAAGSKMSLGEAQATTKLATPMPSDSTLIGPSTVSEVWARSEPTAIVLVKFDSGMAMKFQTWDDTVTETPEEHWASLTKEGIAGDTETVNGMPMFVAPSSPSDIGNIEFVVNGEWINIFGNGQQSADDLKAMAVSTLDSNATAQG